MAKISHKTPAKLERTVTHEGAPAVVPPLQAQLLLTAASTYLGEDTFYETAEAREARLVDLVRQVMKVDPSMVARTALELRHVYRVRTVSVLVACEYLRNGGPDARAVIRDVIARPDECAEVISYWHTRYGRSLPWALRKGVGDAATRVYTERNVLKYDSRNALVAPADVIELTHPKPQAPWQSALFKYLLDERHHGDGMDMGDAVAHLPMIYASTQLSVTPMESRRLALAAYGPQMLADAGYTWERLAGWLPGGMDAEAWEAVIPSMGVMALIRNLRNFDKAGISEPAVERVIDKITDADEVSRSRIFPYRVWAAYRNAPSDNWSRALGKTLDLTMGNVPDFSRSLFLIDFSGSMDAPLSKRATIRRWEVALLMALAAAKHSKDVTIGAFAGHYAELLTDPGSSVLRQVNKAGGLIGSLGWTTHGHTAMAHLFDPAKHDRVVMFTDDQMHDSAVQVNHVPLIITFNLAGYRPASGWGKRRLHVGGFSEATFQIAASLDRGL